MRISAPDLNHYNYLYYYFYQSGQRHAGHRAHQLDRLAVVDVTVSHSELLSFGLLIVHWNANKRSNQSCNLLLP